MGSEMCIRDRAKDGQSDESFGDFVVRTGVIAEVVNSAEDFYA